MRIVQEVLMKQTINRILRLLLIVCLLSTMTGCVYWWRAYRTYLQMDEFDKHFAISVEDSFTVHFKDPILYNEDFVSLAKLRPSAIERRETGSVWHYHFRKLDKQGRVLYPEVRFSFDLVFNQEERITAWIFSPLFLQIAPPEFLEMSFRSLGKAEIFEANRQLKVNTDQVDKIDAALPGKGIILKQIGPPLTVKDKKELEEYLYHFELETYGIEEGYEDRALSEIKLTFDKATEELVKMSGRFAGLKISIDYRDYQQRHQKTPASDSLAGKPSLTLR